MSAQDYPGPPLAPLRLDEDALRCERHPGELDGLCRACARIEVARVRVLDEQIAQLKDACEEGARELAALREEARGRCCPCCALGERWRGPYRAQWVRVVELVRALHGRGAPGDVELARTYHREFWP